MKKSMVEAAMHMARREVSRAPTSYVSAHSRTGNCSATKMYCPGTETKNRKNWGEKPMKKEGGHLNCRNCLISHYIASI